MIVRFSRMSVSNRRPAQLSRQGRLAQRGKHEHERNSHSFRSPFRDIRTRAVDGYSDKDSFSVDRAIPPRLTWESSYYILPAWQHWLQTPDWSLRWFWHLVMFFETKHLVPFPVYRLSENLGPTSKFVTGCDTGVIDKPTKSGPTVDIDILCLVTDCFFDRLLRHLGWNMKCI